jgi:hypothetical protein
VPLFVSVDVCLDGHAAAAAAAAAVAIVVVVVIVLISALYDVTCAVRVTDGVPSGFRFRPGEQRPVVVIVVVIVDVIVGVVVVIESDAATCSSQVTTFVARVHCRVLIVAVGLSYSDSRFSSLSDQHLTHPSANHFPHIEVKLVRST